MKKISAFFVRCLFLVALVAFFALADAALEAYFEGYFTHSGNFWLDDYEITQRDNPDEVWDKVFFGNSTVIAAYREDLSSSGYINFGVDYGSATSLLKILESGEVKIGSELVIGLNWASMYDDMETNPTYFWNRGALEPYSYFQRDRLYTLVTGVATSLITGEAWTYGQYLGQTKIYYYSCLSEQQLAEKLAVYQERYWVSDIEGYSENLTALERVLELCDQRGIETRVVIMPWNPTVAKPEVVKKLDEAIKEVCLQGEAEYLDLSDAFDAECFYDLGHLNYEYGSHVFTEEIDLWLNS